MAHGMRAKTSIWRARLLRSWEKPNLLTVLLTPLSGLYYLAYRLQRLLYERQVFKRYQSPVPVIVVGNLTVGGSGKSPVVAALVTQLEGRGLRVGVISRGYQRASTQARSVDASTPVEEVGDEPAMIYQQTGAPMAVATTREAAIKHLLAQHSLDAILSDDGLQHWPLNADYRICIDDRSVETSNRWVLPAGPYREPRGRLNTMDWVLIHRDEKPEVPSQNEFWLETKALKPVSVVAKASSVVPPEPGSGRVHLVAGIAKPSRFFKSARALGWEGYEHVFADHHQFRLSDLQFPDSRAIVMTEKDAIKCRSFELPNAWCLPVRAQIPTQLIEALVRDLGLTERR